MPAKYAKGTKGAAALFFVLLIAAGVGLYLFSGQTPAVEAQSRTNRIYRPCPGSTTPGRVEIQATGAIDIRPCSTLGSASEVNIVTAVGISSTLTEEGASGGAFDLTTGAGGVTTTAAGTSGDGGTIFLTTGRGGSSSDAASNLSGNGGNIDISGGTGGDRSAAAGTAGRGGIITIDAGTGGTGSGGASNGPAGEIRIGQSIRSNVEIGRDLSVTYIGDVPGTGNGTLLTVDDSAGEILFAGSAAAFNAGASIGTGQVLTFITGSLGLNLDRTTTAAGTTGNRTISKMAGTVNFAAGATAITVTNTLVATTSYIFAIARTNDATCSVKNVVPGAGSFVINMTAACTAETSVAFWVTN